ncbi:coenzyme F420-0:L-glutamate ligase [Patescibacteria group bacterium]|nr:coenzyme F420-0:L-glutamate ligase [Patescibacteria group bacterium]
MDFIPVKTRKFIPPQDKGELLKLLDEFLPPLKDKDMVIVTSKIVAIDQGRYVKITKTTDRIQLIKQEAEAYVPTNPSSMTIKEHTLTPYAGIDRSNSHGHYILWPNQPHQTAKKIWSYLRRRDKINNLGVIIADSTCHPMRRGHFGISIGFFGFRPVYWYKKQKDIFGRKLVRHCQNLVDALAAIGVIYMGEGSEQTPLLIIRGFSKISFSGRSHLKEFWVARQDDLYAPLLAPLSR